MTFPASEMSEHLARMARSNLEQASLAYAAKAKKEQAL